MFLYTTRKYTNNREVSVTVHTILSHLPWEIKRILSTICLRMNRKARVACNFNYRFENEGLLKVTQSRTLWMW